MTQPDDPRRTDRQTNTSAECRLRAELLTSGLDDLVSLAEMESIITHYGLAATTAAQQDLTLSVIRSVVGDGLMKFEGWDDLSLNEAMARVRDLFVTQYDDPGAWAFAVWLRLTDRGRRVAEGSNTNPAD